MDYKCLRYHVHPRLVQTFYTVPSVFVVRVLSSNLSSKSKTVSIQTIHCNSGSLVKIKLVPSVHWCCQVFTCSAALGKRVPPLKLSDFASPAEKTCVLPSLVGDSANLTCPVFGARLGNNGKPRKRSIAPFVVRSGTPFVANIVTSLHPALHFTSCPHKTGP